LRLPDLDRLARLGAEVTAFARRRRESREPRVRLRVAHAEARVVPEDDPSGKRLLSLADDLVSEYGDTERGRA
jgi:hypothetical protein